MSEIILWGYLSSPEEVVGILPGCEDTYLLLEKEPVGRFLEEEPDKNLIFLKGQGHEIDFFQWEKGRIFNYLYEISWRKEHDGFRVVYTGNSESRPRVLSYAGPDLEKCTIAARKYYLWGKRVCDPAEIGILAPGPVYLEVRIPRLLFYPVEGLGKSVDLLVKEFYCRETGILQYYRYCGLEEEES